MPMLLLALLLLLQLLHGSTAMDLGIGDLNLITNPYDPYCAMACLRSIYGLLLTCSGADSTMLGMVAMQTSAECWATNEPYLETLAYCMHTRCASLDIKASKLELFWETQATGQSNAGQLTATPKWTYAQALMQVDPVPTIVIAANAEWLNVTSLVPDEFYNKQWNVLVAVQEETARENLFGLVLLAAGVLTPVLLTCCSYLPFPNILKSRIRASVIWPSLFRGYHVRPLPYLLGKVPTIGQTLYITVFVVLNIILTAVSYQSRQPNAWYATQWREITAYVLYRTGALAYIFAPLIFLFAGRNNFLLYISDWSQSTFLVLHRWVARVFAAQAILHSILGVVLYAAEGTYTSNVSEPYWIWGIVATISTVALCLTSSLYVRSRGYELFLVLHIILSLILIVACWYHAYDLYRYLGGYSIWLVCCAAVWGFDRIMRFLRIMTIGPQRAQAYEIDEKYVRLDIPGVHWTSEPGKHVYCYFPSLTPWRVWENHPFSILPTHLVSSRPMEETDSQQGIERSSSDIEKNHHVSAYAKSADVSPPNKTNGITLFVRRSAGLTRHLRESKSLLMFLEGPYSGNHAVNILRCDRLLLISGGIGITGLLSFAHNHKNVKLCWSLKESAICLAKELSATTDRIADKDLRIGSRLDIPHLFNEETAAGWESIGVVVCGPGGLCDDVRACVSKAGQVHKTHFELKVEAYSW